MNWKQNVEKLDKFEKKLINQLKFILSKGSVESGNFEKSSFDQDAELPDVVFPPWRNVSVVNYSRTGATLSQTATSTETSDQTAETSAAQQRRIWLRTCASCNCFTIVRPDCSLFYAAQSSPFLVLKMRAFGAKWTFLEAQNFFLLRNEVILATLLGWIIGHQMSLWSSERLLSQHEPSTFTGEKANFRSLSVVHHDRTVHVTLITKLSVFLTIQSFVPCCGLWRDQETTRSRLKNYLPFVMMRRIRPWNSAKNLHRDDGYKSIVRMCCVCVLLISDWNASSWLNTHVTGHVMRDPHKSKAVKGDQVTMELSKKYNLNPRNLSAPDKSHFLWSFLSNTTFRF